MCGIIGIIGNKNIKNREASWSSYECYRGLMTMQHRGQDAAGILTYDFNNKKFYQEKDLGLVNEVFSKENINRLTGDLSIGHTRYATVGSDSREDLQPLVTGFPLGLGLVHNGNIVNYHPLVSELKENYQYQLLTQNDLEAFMHLFGKSLLDSRKDIKATPTFDEIVDGARFIFEKAVGGFAVLGAIANLGLVAMRDPNGIRPLVLGRREHPDYPGLYDYCFASETKALSFLGYKFVKDVEAGEVILITETGEVMSKVLVEKEKKHHCMFEWVYFAGAESQIENQTVYKARLNLGHSLAQKVKVLMDKNEISPDYVCPVPDTSRTSSISLAETLGLPYREGLIKNRYIQRSFILNSQEKRDKAVELKLTPVKSEIKGKNILLVDDSVVRGTTSKKIISLLKKNGAKEVTLAITCPPLRHPCFYGIDFPDHNELIANGKSIDEISDYVGANKVIYLDEDDLVKSIGNEGLCLACINGKYPTPMDGADEFRERRNLYKKG